MGRVGWLLFQVRGASAVDVQFERLSQSEDGRGTGYLRGESGWKDIRGDGTGYDAGSASSKGNDKGRVNNLHG